MITISHTTTTLAATKAAANIPHACEMRVMPRINRSIGVYLNTCEKTAGGNPASRSRPELLHCERFVDQFLAVGHFTRELLVGAVLRDLEPGLVFGRGKGGDLDVVLLEDI